MMKKPSHRKVNQLAQSYTGRSKGRLIPQDNQHVISDRKQNKGRLFFFLMVPLTTNAQYPGQFQLQHLSVSLTSTNHLQEPILRRSLLTRGFICSGWHIHTAASTVCQSYEPSCLNIFQKMLHKN